MRYPACEKLEVIRLVEQSHLPVRRYSVGDIYRWYDRCQDGEAEARADRSPRRNRHGNASLTVSVTGSSN